MKPSEVVNALEVLTDKNSMLPAYLWGAPGVGKSSLIHQVAKRHNINLIDIRCVLLDAVDLRGIPAIKMQDEKKMTEWCQPIFLPTEGEGILFLDELAQAPQMVQSACLQLVLDRKLGEYELPTGWRIVAASNRNEDRAGAHRVITPLLNRFVHLDFDVNIEDWLEWASTADIHPMIQYFIKWKPSNLLNFKPELNQKAFASPRTWEFCSKIINNKKVDITNSAQLLEGCLGNVASEFIAFVRLKDKLPDIELIMKDPENAPVPKDEASVMWALCGALHEKLYDKGNYESYYRYITRFPAEFSIMSYKQARKSFPDIASHPARKDWYTKFKPYMN